MAFDLGDPVPLSFLTYDSTGLVLADVTTPALTITLPDQSTVTPAVAKTATGTYAPTTPYIAVQAGIHRVSWVGTTGAQTQERTDTFNILPADPRFLISLADARAGLGTISSNTVKDEDLRSFIAAATPIMENIVGPILRTSRVETYDGGSPQIVLINAPLISISSIIESYGSNYQRTLTAQDVFAGSSLDAFGYTVDLASGVLTRRSAGRAIPFAYGKRNIQVSYVSGRTSVTGNLLLATRLVIRQLWLVAGQQGYRPNMGAPDTSGASTGASTGFAVPNAVLELCAAHTRPPGVA